MKTSPAPAWAQLKEGQKPEERGGGRTAAEERDLRRKHSTCVWKKNIFFEQTRLSASFPRSTIICAQFCFQKERKNITGEGQRGKENSFATGEQTLQGLRGLCRGWRAGGSGQGWGARLPPPILGPGAGFPHLQRGWQHLAQSHPRAHGPGPQTPHWTYCVLGLGRCDTQELRLQAARRAL